MTLPAWISRSRCESVNKGRTNRYAPSLGRDLTGSLGFEMAEVGPPVNAGRRTLDAPYTRSATIFA